MVIVKHDASGDLGCWFVKANNRGVVIDGKSNPWFVVVPQPLGAKKGDLVKVAKADGSSSWVQLVTEYPYASRKIAEERTRWTFVSVNEDGSLDRIGRENADFDAAEAARTDKDPSDDRPTWWSRKEDGSVRWPQDGQVWRERATGDLGVVLRDKMNVYRVGWYPLLEDVVPATFEDAFPEGIPHDLYGKGEWMSSGELMDEFAFVWKPLSRTERMREWARAQGYEVKNKGRLRQSIVEAYELAEEKG